jgi:nucleotide-binding universal stress UspA family protein
MFEKILVPLDGSELAEKAIPYAKAIASAKGSEIVLFAVSLFTSGDKQDRLLKSYLELQAKNLGSSGLKVTFAVAYGNVADEISNFTEKNKIDLKVISTHGYSGLKQWFMGSVAMKVLNIAHTPLLLVKSRTADKAAVKFNKILFPVDGSAFSVVPIPYIAELVKGTGAQVIVVQVVEPPVVPSYSQDRPINPTWQQYRDVLWEEGEKQAKGNLELLEKDLKQHGLNVVTKLIRGEVVPNIMKVAADEKVDLIVMSTHGRTGAARWAYGNVARRLVEESPQPVLAIRPSIPEGQVSPVIPTQLP